MKAAPAPPPAPATGEARSWAAERRPGAGREPARKRVLIIEDDADTRDVFRQALEHGGYEVSTAGNGREGLERLETAGRPCVILLDLMMPEMDGLEFLARLGERRDEERPPVVIVSAFDDLAARARGAAGFLEKPVRLERLLEIVRDHCGPPG